MSEEARRVAEIVACRRGRAEAIAMPDLAHIVFGDSSPASTRRVQQIVSELILEHGKPIGSATVEPTGYYTITDVAELDRASEQLEHRIQNLSRRRASLQRHRNALAGQMKLGMKAEG